jgi:predicted dehydrogenase
MQNRRFGPWARAIASAVADGVVGPPSIVSVDYFMRVSWGGFRNAMDNPLLLDMAIHHFDQVRQFSPVPVTRVSCVETSPEGSPFAGNAAAVCMFERADGSLVSYRGSWWTGGFSSTWAGTWRLSGPMGSIVWDGDGSVVAQIVNDEGTVAPFEIAPAAGGRVGHAGCIDEMLDAMAAGRPAETDVEDNLQSLAMVEAAVESARRGEPVEVSS